MPPELALARPLAAAIRLPEHWRRPLGHLCLAWFAILALLAPVWMGMLRQYWDSSTYNHILFVPAILLWLVWLRAEELKDLRPVAWWPGLLPLAGALFLWLLGEISGLALATHLAVVLALQACVLVVLGPRIATALLFPLAYGLFLVPFGDDLVPALQMVTAKLTIALTQLSGVPAHIEGVFIDTPAGLFEVAEACSGVKFLIAMIALGTLTAHICFASWRRRALFMAAAIVLPIAANGVRAWGTIFIAQSQGIEFAAGFDHIVYGWIFFALVMALLLALSWRFFDRSPDDDFIDEDALAGSPLLDAVERYRVPESRALVAVAALCLAALAWSVRAHEVEAPLPTTVALPEVAGWRLTEYEPDVWWEPRASGADHRMLGTYRDSSGHSVDVFVALYAAQEEGREAGGFGEGALTPGTVWRWHSPGPPVENGTSEWLRGGDAHRLAVTFYRHRDTLGGSVARLKLSNIRDRLTLDAHPTLMLIVSAQDRYGHEPDKAVSSFVAAIDPAGEWMDRLAQRP